MSEYMVNVDVYVGESGQNDWPPEDAQEFLRWVQEKLSEIPPEHMARATVEFSSDSDYETPYAMLNISYLRPETAEETAARQREEAAEREWHRQRELQQLYELNIKYSGLLAPSEPAKAE